MNNKSTDERIDELSINYITPRNWDNILFWLFIVTTILSISITIISDQNYLEILRNLFIISIIVNFVLTVMLKYWLMPEAEGMRRKQLLSDAYDAALTDKKTNKYYNNKYSASHLRLGANIFENSFFGKSITNSMLKEKRIWTAIIFLIWIYLVINRNTSFDTVLWISQFVFGTGLIASWINLEILNQRFIKVFDNLHHHFLHNVGDKTPESIASLLNEFSSYESAKATAGIVLKSKIFEKNNERLSREWNRIKIDLNMES